MAATLRAKNYKQLGASAVEYALALAVITTMVMAGAKLMTPQLEAAFSCAGEKIKALATGGEVSCGGTEQSNQSEAGGPDPNYSNGDSETQETTDNNITTPTWPSPTGKGERKCDGFGCGHYGASRGSRKHKGIDYEATAGDDTVAIQTGIITKIGWPYANDEYRYIEITTDDGYVIREMYIKPDADLKVGDKVSQGEKVGEVQSLQKRYPNITDHVHVEIRKDGKIIDPSTVINSN